MPTKTTCRIASDVDLLSRLQLEEVLAQLCNYGARHSVEFSSPSTLDFLTNSDTQPGTQARRALLLHALLEGEFDSLVLDATILPARIPTGLTIGAITARITPYDALIASEECILDELGENAVVAINCARRAAQMLYYRHDLRIVHARGSVDSLIQKVKSGKVDAAVVAAADMERMNKHESVVELLTSSVCIPAPGQGALAVLVRSSEEQFRGTLQSINDVGTYSMLRAEWACIDHLGVDCSAPVGVLGCVTGKALELEGMLALPDGSEKIQFLVKGSLGHEEDLGRTLASEIIAGGGAEILKELRI